MMPSLSRPRLSRKTALAHKHVLVDQFLSIMLTAPPSPMPPSIPSNAPYIKDLHEFDVNLEDDTTAALLRSLGTFRVTLRSSNRGTGTGSMRQHPRTRWSEEDVRGRELG